jgi:hypothetical protein
MKEKSSSEECDFNVIRDNFVYFLGELLPMKKSKNRGVFGSDVIFVNLLKKSSLFES